MDEKELDDLLERIWVNQSSTSDIYGADFLAFREAVVNNPELVAVLADLSDEDAEAAVQAAFSEGVGVLDIDTSGPTPSVTAVTSLNPPRNVEDFTSPIRRDLYILQLQESAAAQGLALTSNTEELMESLGIDEDLAILVGQGQSGLIRSEPVLRTYGLLDSEDLGRIYDIVVERGAGDPNTLRQLENIDLNDVATLIFTDPDFEYAASLVTAGRSQQIRKVNVGPGEFQMVHDYQFTNAMNLPGMDAVLVEAAIGANYRSGNRSDMWSKLAFVASQRNVGFLGSSVDDPEMVSRLRADATEIAGLIIETVAPYETVEELQDNKLAVVNVIGEENYEFAKKAVEQKQPAEQDDEGLGGLAGLMAGALLRGERNAIADLAGVIAPELRDRYQAENDFRNYRDLATTEMESLAVDFRNKVNEYGGPDAGGAVLAILELSGFEDMAAQAWETGQLDAENQARLNNWVYSDGNYQSLVDAGFTNIFQNSYWQTLLQGADTGEGYGQTTVEIPAVEDLNETYRGLYRAYFMVDPSDEQLQQFVQQVEGEAMGYQRDVVGSANIFKDGMTQANQLKRQMRSTENIALGQIRSTELYDRLYSNRGNTTEAQYLSDFTTAVGSVGVPLSTQTEAVYAGMETGDIGTAKFRAATSEAGRESGSVKGAMAKIAQTMARLT